MKPQKTSDQPDPSRRALLQALSRFPPSGLSDAVTTPSAGDAVTDRADARHNDHTDDGAAADHDASANPGMWR